MMGLCHNQRYGKTAIATWVLLHVFDAQRCSAWLQSPRSDAGPGERHILTGAFGMEVLQLVWA